MKTLCIYHGNCADGFGAALAVRIGLGEDNVEFHKGIYGESPPDVTGRKVILVDFSYKRDVLLDMAENAMHILVIDHHKTAEADLVDLPTNIKVLFDMTKSGAVMAWVYFHPTKPIPRLLLHIQDQDLWKFELEGTNEIMKSVFSYPYDFSTWSEFLTIDLLELYNEGLALDRKYRKDVAELTNEYSFRAIIAGYNVPILNAPRMYTSGFRELKGKDELFTATYYDHAEGRTYSLRSSEEGIDVSKVAEIFGGGGHMNAAGFNVNHSEVGHVCLNAEAFEKLKNGE